MQIIKIYKYTRMGGGITVSPVKPEGEYTEMVRLIADEGKVLTNGEDITSCIDTDTADGWSEIEDEANETDEPIENEATEQDYQNALADLGVRFNA